MRRQRKRWLRGTVKGSLMATPMCDEQEMLIMFVVPWYVDSTLKTE